MESFMHDLKLPFVYSEVCIVHNPIHLFTFVIVGGYARPGVLHGALTGG